ncbi:MAG: polyprenyl synthetase family protein [Clostridia bacterium]|nr:polyprenyl synthetase family protein [Clostridia bacterium]
MFVNIQIKLTEVAASVETMLKKYFEGTTGELAEAMQYSLLGGGKRIRAFLTVSFAEMFGGTVEQAMPFACALEMIHAYSLIHDDLPAMDNDDMRRGKPSCHKQYGEATALLAGDSLLTMAFDVCASNTYVSDRSVRLAVKSLAMLAGHLGMCGGQEIDLAESVASYEELKHLHALKTGALIKAACLLGLYAATDDPEANTVSAISKYAEALGLAFQIHDDILDVTSDSETLGKPVGSDAKNDKKTALSYMSLDEAVVEEDAVTRRAVEAISEFPDSDVPAQLAVWLMSRKN